MKAFSLFILFMGIAQTSFSQTVAQDEAKQKELNTLFSLINLDEGIQAERLYIQELYEEFMRDTGSMLTEAQAASHTSALKSILDQHMDAEQVRSEIAAVYAESFSLDELQAINKFYASPIGQRLEQQRVDVAEQTFGILQQHFTHALTTIETKLALNNQHVN